MSDLVSMNISPDIIKPIVQAKINEAIAAALGGPESIVASIVDRVLATKVNEHGNVGSYSSDNKYTWLDAVVSKQIKEAVTIAVKEEIINSSSQIKSAIKKHIQSKQGSSDLADLLLSSLTKSIENQYRTTVSVEFKKQSSND